MTVGETFHEWALRIEQEDAERARQALRAMNEIDLLLTAPLDSALARKHWGMSFSIGSHPHAAAFECLNKLTEVAHELGRTKRELAQLRAKAAAQAHAHAYAHAPTTSTR